MKKIILFAIIILSNSLWVNAALKPIASAIDSKIKNGTFFTSVDLFETTNATKNYINQLKDAVSEAEVMQLDYSELNLLYQQAPSHIEFKIPFNNGSNKILKLYKTDIFAPGFNLFASANPEQTVAYQGGVHYWGIIDGDVNSIAAISIFENEVMGLITSSTDGNFVLGKLENAPMGFYVFYNDKYLTQSNPSSCATEDNDIGYTSTELQDPDRAIGDCIRLFWEVNYDIFTGKGSVANAANYVTGLFNQSAIVYANDGITVELSEVFVWNTVSPYVATSTSGLLSQFQTYRNTINGDLGHLLGYNGGGGIAAGFNGICASNLNSSQCYSGVNSSYNNVPTYSWSVMVVTHEQGHLMGCRHTHSCAWNGNNTAIDNCGPTAGYGYEGSCNNAPTPTGGGTIMSYCHLVGGVGINLANGFGLQPKNVIINKVNNATCLTVCLGNTCLPSANMNTTAISNTSATFNWAAVTGAVSYHVRYRIIGTTNWQMTTVAGTSYQATGLTPGANYEWQVETICTSGSSIFTISTDFITIPLTCDIPNNQITSNIYYYGGTFTWDAAPGAISYNLRYRATGTSTWTTVLVTQPTYSVYSLTQTTEYEWQVQTNCTGGGVSAFGNSVIFTTPMQPCMVPEFIYTTNITSSSATLNYTQGAGTQGGGPANIRYRVVGTSVWTTVSTSTNYNAIGLLPGTEYEWQAENICGLTTSGYSQSSYFTTLCNPSAAIISANGPTTFCIGQSVVLSAGPVTGYTYQWYNNGAPILNATLDSYTASGNGNYYLTESIGGCIDTSNTISVIVNSLPAVTIIPNGATQLCPGGSVVLTSSETIGNVWSTGATTASITVNSAGTYTVVHTNANNCSASASIVISNTLNCIPTTQLTNTFCAIQNLALNAAIACTAVAGATNYDFEFTNLTTNAVGVKTVTSTNVSLSSVTPALQFGTQYNVRVRAKVGGVYGNYGAVCVIGTVCNPTICGVPLTQLRSTDCGKLNLSPLTGLVIANAVVAASHYEFEIRDISTNAIYATKLQTSNALVINTVIPALQWNTQYNVKVRAYIGGIAGTYGNNCVIGFIPDPVVSGVPNTQLSTASCGKLNLALTGSITCTAVTGAGSYEWEFKNQANTTVVATKTTTSTSLNLSTVTGLQWNTQYNVRVRAYIGAVAGTYNVSCLIGLIPDPAINGVPSTKIRTNDCGKLNFGLGGFVVADPVSGAVEYEFEIRDNVTNAFIANKFQASNGLTFSTVPAFTWGMQYKISVRARISNTWGTFGTPCTIGFICDPNVCGVPTTALRSTDCGKLNLNFSTGLVVATTVNGATLYEFEITDLTTNAVNVQSRTTMALVINTVVPAMQNNRQYSIRVRATISGVVGTYGNACIIGFASGSREGMAEGNEINTQGFDTNITMLKIMLYPNPFSNTASYMIQSAKNENIQLQIIDIFGKVVVDKNVTSNENMLIGEGLAKGNYFIKAINATGEQAVFRMVKVE